MPHESKLIALIAVGFVLALAFGFAAARVRLPPLVGYLVAGIAIGPFTPGFVADSDLASELAEIGVILLMFGVGLHFSIATLLRVRRIALPGAIAQIAVATAVGGGLARWWGWDLSAGLVFGLALSVASTVVLLRALEQRNELDSVSTMTDPEKSLVPELGIVGVEIDKRIAAAAGAQLRDPYGVIVVARAAGAAGEIPLQPKDVIRSLNNRKMPTLDALRDAMRSLKPGAPVTLQVQREGKLMYVSFAID